MIYTKCKCIIYFFFLTTEINVRINKKLRKVYDSYGIFLPITPDTFPHKLKKKQLIVISNYVHPSSFKWFFPSSEKNEYLVRHCKDGLRSWFWYIGCFQVHTQSDKEEVIMMEGNSAENSPAHCLIEEEYTIAVPLVCYKQLCFTLSMWVQ